jgi:hypothetical protein
LAQWFFRSRGVEVAPNFQKSVAEAAKIMFVPPPPFFTIILLQNDFILYWWYKFNLHIFETIWIIINIL